MGGFDDRYKYILDFDLWLSMAVYGLVEVLPQKLNYFMIRKDSNTGKVLSGEQKAYYNEHVFLLNKNAAGLKLTKFNVWFSKLSRRARTMGYGLWLRCMLRKG